MLSTELVIFKMNSPSKLILIFASSNSSFWNKSSKWSYLRSLYLKKCSHLSLRTKGIVGVSFKCSILNYNAFPPIWSGWLHPAFGRVEIPLWDAEDSFLTDFVDFKIIQEACNYSCSRQVLPKGHWFRSLVTSQWRGDCFCLDSSGPSLVDRTRRTQDLPVTVLLDINRKSRFLLSTKMTLSPCKQLGWFRTDKISLNNQELIYNFGNSCEIQHSVWHFFKMLSSLILVFNLTLKFTFLDHLLFYVPMIVSKAETY
jgi:hypothetical protein